MKITIEHDDGRIEVRENIFSVHTFSEVEFRCLIEYFNYADGDPLTPEEVEKLRPYIKEDLDPGFYSVMEWELDIIGDLRRRKDIMGGEDK